MKTAESIGNGGDNKLTSKGGFTEMKKLLFIGLAILLALTIGAGAAFAGENPPKPNLLVTKIVDLVADGVNSTVRSMNNITNIGAVNATVTNVTDTLYCQTGGGWDMLGTPQVDDNDGNGYEIAVGESLDLDYLFEFELPEEARALKNVVEVKIEGRTKVFQAIWTTEFESEDEEPKGEEPVDNDSKGEPVAFTEQTMWQAGKSHCYHVSGNGTSGRLNCQIDGNGYIKGVFNGKVSGEGPDYCLYLGEEPLVCGTANKNGKLHIKVEGVQIPDWNPDSYTEYVFSIR